MVLKLKSRTVLRPLTITGPLMSLVCLDICQIVQTDSSNLFLETSLQ